MSIHTPDTTLSANDARILNALFDPETLPSSVAKSKNASIIDSSLPSHPHISPAQLSNLEHQQNEIIQKVSSGVDVVAIEKATEELDQVLAEWPTYPSAFVNRAMLGRIQLESQHSEKTIFDASEEAIGKVFSDLSQAIHVALPTSSPTDPVSTYQARILRTAYSHRAYLYLKAAEAGVVLKGRGKSELEEQASSDFAAAARYGDEVAREMSVRTNPYAKMCGAIVRNALAEERLAERT